jgi:hypothetical protein
VFKYPESSADTPTRTLIIAANPAPKTSNGFRSVAHPPPQASSSPASLQSSPREESVWQPQSRHAFLGICTLTATKSPKHSRPRNVFRGSQPSFPRSEV